MRCTELTRTGGYRGTHHLLRPTGNVGLFNSSQCLVFIETWMSGK